MLRGANENAQQEDHAYNKTLFSKYPNKPTKEQIDYALRFEENPKNLQKIINYENED